MSKRSKEIRAGFAGMGAGVKVGRRSGGAALEQHGGARFPQATALDKREEARRKALANLEAMTDEEDAAITADALADPDNPPADDLIRRRGRPAMANPKEPVKLRIDADVLDHFRATGRGWQTRMNDVLRKAAGLK